MIELLRARRRRRGLLCRGRRGIVMRLRNRPVIVAADVGRCFDPALAWLHAGQSFDRAGDTGQEIAEIGNVDEGNQQPDDPENMHVREERDQAETGDELELNFLCLVRDVLGQRMQAEVQNAEKQ